MARLKHLQFRIEAAAVRLALRLVRALPVVAASNIGGAVARAIGPLLAVSRVADANLRLALPELDAAARRRVVRGVWDNLGRVIAELPHLPEFRETAAGPGWVMEGWETAAALLASGGPAIFFGGHIDNWELPIPAAATRGLLVSGLYRAAANPLVDGILLKLRQRAIGAEVPMFAKGAAGARGALTHLRAGGVIAFLIDQKMNDGISVDFFGHPAMTAPAGAALALRFRCPVIPCRAERLGPARYRIVVEPPLPLPDSGDRHADVAALTAAMNACLERWIRERPASWLWLHRRWPKELIA